MERRKAPRVTLNHIAKLSIDSREVLCTLKNLTSGGALALVNASFSKNISREDSGKPVSLHLEFGSSENRSFEGLLVRLDVMDDVKFVAIKFYEPESIADIPEK